MILIKGLKKYFGGLKAVDIDKLKVGVHKVEGLIGPNGAGKTTLLKIIMGEYAPDAGRIIYNGKNIVGKSTWEIVNSGIVSSHQLIQEIPSLTVKENLMLAMDKQGKSESIFDPFKRKTINEVERKAEKKAEEVLKRVFLLEKKDALASDLSVGQKKLVDIARCLMKDPKMLILDEPVTHVRGYQKKTIIDFIKNAPFPILLVEHNINVIWEVSTHVFFMSEGKVLIQGTPDKVRKNEKVIREYLGA